MYGAEQFLRKSPRGNPQEDEVTDGTKLFTFVELESEDVPG